VAEWKDRLNESPHNPSLSPGVQHPHAKPPSAKPKSQRKRGGQPGHPRYERALTPGGAMRRSGGVQADRLPSLWVELPRPRQPSRRPRSAAASRVELPDLKPTITEYQRHRLICCG
jgi:transposase